jgi:CubicO group peptidase (beta-lactamase class C family)
MCTPKSAKEPPLPFICQPFRCWASLEGKRYLAQVRVSFLCLVAALLIGSSWARAETPSMSLELSSLFTEFDHPDSPGACVMVIRNGKVILKQAYGLADLEQGVPCRTNTNFRLASVTKQFTAMAVLILAERKKLSVNERLTDLLPEFPKWGEQITVRHLLTHTSGVIDYEDIIPKGTELPVLDRDVLRLLKNQKETYFAPGSKFRYSNSGYALLAQIVEIRSGMTFARFLEQNIFQPLKMNATVAYEEGISVIANRAYGYSPKEAASFKRTDQSLTSSVLGDGGIYSSIGDLFKWDQALYTSKLVKAKTLSLAFTPAIPSEHANTDYGFGWYISSYRGLREVWHSGNTMGFTSRITRFPEKRFSIVILCNRSDAKIAEMPHQIADRLLFTP